MNITPELLMQFVAYGLSIGIIYGTIKQQISAISDELRRLRVDYKEEIQMLRKEVEKHNQLVERTYRLEAELCAMKERGSN